MGLTDATQWLRSRRPLGLPTARLLCLPYAGGGATIFHAWSDGVPPGVEVRAAQLPGRQDRLAEPGLRSVTAIIDRLFGALQALPPAPLVVYGHSFGAVLAYELAQQLRSTPFAPCALLVGARRAPQLQAHGSDIHNLPDFAFKQELHRRYGTPWTLMQDAELMSLTLPSLRADFAALETYRYRAAEPLEIPVTVFRGTRDVAFSTEDAAAWRDRTSATTVIHELDAGHFFVDTHRAWVLTHVAECLSAVLARQAT